MIWVEREGIGMDRCFQQETPQIQYLFYLHTPILNHPNSLNSQNAIVIFWIFSKGIRPTKNNRLRS